jgi:hypothetical protein
MTRPLAVGSLDFMVCALGAIRLINRKGVKLGRDNPLLTGGQDTRGLFHRRGRFKRVLGVARRFQCHTVIA